MKTAILQSNYIPWKGYFHLIKSVDTFVLYDSVQFTKNDWRNRNKIVIGGSPAWLTIPVRHHNLTQTISETTVANKFWAKKHWKSIQQAYSKAPFFKDFRLQFEDCYRKCGEIERLSKINFLFIERICDILKIDTKIITDDHFQLPEDRIERLLEICSVTGATTYVSGPAAKSYIDEAKFLEHGINIQWIDYCGYLPYKQLSSEFDHFVSILDLLFCYGPDFENYLGQ